MTAAAIKATFSDWRPVKSRNVLQLVLEVPIELTELVLTTLGAPMPGAEKWVGVALLKFEPPAREEEPAKPAREKRAWRDIPKAAQAGIAANDPGFQNWLWQSSTRAWEAAEKIHGVKPANEIAAATTRLVCKVDSRAEFDTDPKAGARWTALHTKFLQETKG